MTRWDAPHSTGPLDAIVRVPGSKSLTNRYLVLAALAEGATELDGVLRARDTELMMAGLGALGARIEAVPAHHDAAGDSGERVVVRPGPLRAASIDCGLAGTVMRFLPPLSALARGTSHFDGDAAARTRPMGPLLAALAALGAGVVSDRGHLPVAVTGSGSLPGGDVEIDAAASSQFLSALLLAAPAMTNGLRVRATGPVPSLPHVAMTCQALTRFGGQVSEEEPGRIWRVAPGGLAGQSIAVEPDLTNAGPFLAAALVAGGQVTISGWPGRTTQAGVLLPGLLARMGARVTTHARADDAGQPGGQSLTVTGAGGRIEGIDAGLGDAGELVPTLAALAALARTPSRLSGIGHLRGHETDRLAALVAEITKLGGTARETDDGIEIDPAPLHGAHLSAYGDHRMAMFAAIIGLRVPGVSLDDIGATTKTLPTFPALWAAMLAGRA